MIHCDEIQYAGLSWIVIGDVTLASAMFLDILYLLQYYSARRPTSVVSHHYPEPAPGLKLCTTGLSLCPQFATICSPVSRGRWSAESEYRFPWFRTSSTPSRIHNPERSPRTKGPRLSPPPCHDFLPQGNGIFSPPVAWKLHPPYWD